MNQELPKISNSVYGTATHCYDPNDLTFIDDNTFSKNSISTGRWIASSQNNDLSTIQKLVQDNSSLENLMKGTLDKMAKANEEARRYVQIFIVDPDSKIPLDKAVLYKGEPQMTDLSNEELFFTIPMMDLLQTHNDFRKSHIVEDEFVATEKTRKRHLKPIRIKDLSMTVVTIAQF